MVILGGVVQVRVKTADDEKGEVILLNGEVRKGTVKISNPR